MKINRLEIENTKRIRAVVIEPKQNGLTVVGGRNGQGKTSVLDAIAWALGGDKYRPSSPARAGSAVPPMLKVTMSNGLVVERSGKNSSLKVTDPSGEKAGQKLLDSFVEKLALDLPRFMESSEKEKASTLLKIIGVGDELEALDREEKEKYAQRHAIGQIADQKKKFADEQTYYPDAPKEPVSVSELIRDQQEILARNGQRQQWIREHDSISNEISETQKEIRVTQERLEALIAVLDTLKAKEKDARKSPEELQMESTDEIEQSIENIEEINRQVRANEDKLIAEQDAQDYKDRYDTLTAEIEAVRQKKTDLLKSADLPLPDLSVEDGSIIYRGQKWDNMSGAEQLQVATAIIRKLNPQCGFILIDKLEQMDVDTMNEFGAWLEKEGLQAIATRVSTGSDGDCTILIEDGYAVEDIEVKTAAKKWEEGKF